MRRIYLVLLAFCCLSTISASYALTNEGKGTKEELDLMGDFPPDKIRSLVKPIEAFLTEQFIEVNFYSDLGTVTVSIFDEMGGIVYQQAVNTYDGQQLFIDITWFDPGAYTIVLVNSDKLYLFGSFEII